MRRWRRPLATTLTAIGVAAMGVAVTGCTGARATSTPPTVTSTPPTVAVKAPRTSTPITKVLTVIEENHTRAEMQSAMPYLGSLARQYAYATGYTALAHPSLPNYLAIAGGSTFGVTDDTPPSASPIAGDSVFDQAIAAGRTARVYAEAMTTNCERTDVGLYAVRHNPWAYFADASSRASCARDDVPAGSPASGALASDVAAGTLPNVGLLVPNLCDDAHNGGSCSLGVADDYLKFWLPQIMAGPDFRSGHLAVVVTADENDRSTSANNVLTVVVTPGLNGAHLTVTAPLSHYSLSAWYSRLTGSAPLHDSAAAPDMPAAFDLP